MLLTVKLTSISFSSPIHSFIPGLKPSFSANPSHRCLSFSSSGLSAWIPQTFTVTSVLFQALGPYTHKTHNTHTKRT